MSSAISTNTTRIPGRRGKHAASAGSRRSKPNSARYLYDDNNNDDQSVGDVSSLSGFAMAPYEDDRSELTFKANNLSSIKYGRKFPKHHSGYHQEIHWHPQFQQKRVRFAQQELADDATPISALTEDAIMSMHYHDYEDSMRYGNAVAHHHHHSLSDEESDAEYPTNGSHSHSSETRSTAELSFEDEEEDEQIRLMVYGGSDDDDLEMDSIGIVSQKRPPLLLRCLPSAGTMSRWFFLMGCVLTLWMAIDSLSWAKQQDKEEQDTSSSPSSSFQTRLRKLSTRTIGREFTHQDQWNDNSQWSQLNMEQQDSWTELGFGEQQWDDHDGVSSDNIDWDHLTQDQKDAAEDLGFSKPIWDASVGSHTTNETSDTSDTVSRGNEIELPKEEATTATTTSAPETSTTSPASDPPIASETNPPAAATPTPAPTSSTTSKEKDPIMFTTASGSIPITKYMILSFAAALCFTMVGIMEWIQYDFLFQLLLAISGVFGLLSAMFVERNPGSSVAFHTLSVHCFLGSSVAILWLRCRQPTMPAQSRRGRVANRTQEEALLLADLCFAVGSAMMVVSSYLTLSYGANQAALLVDIQRFDVFAAILWVICAVIYLCCAYKARSTQELP